MVGFPYALPINRIYFSMNDEVNFKKNIKQRNEWTKTGYHSYSIGFEIVFCSSSMYIVYCTWRFFFSCWMRIACFIISRISKQKCISGKWFCTRIERIWWISCFLRMLVIPIDPSLNHHNKWSSSPSALSLSYSFFFGSILIVVNSTC